MTKGDKLQVRKSDGDTFPATFDNQGECRSCGAAIFWTETPKGRKMPVDAQPDADDAYTSHFATCPQADSHRGGGSAQPKPSSAAPVPPQPTLAERVKKLEEAVFGKKSAGIVDIPPADDSLPF